MENDWGTTQGPRSTPDDVARWADLLGWQAAVVVSSWSSRTAHFTHIASHTENHRAEALARSQPTLTEAALTGLYQTGILLFEHLDDQAGCSAPRPLAIDVATRTVLWQYLPGHKLSSLLRAADSPTTAVELSRRAGTTLAAFHRETHPQAGPTNGHPVAMRFGDFAPYNIVVSGDRLHLIDPPPRLALDGIEHDLSSFSFQVRRTFMKRIDRIDRATTNLANQCVDAFLDAYSESVGIERSTIDTLSNRAETRRALGLARKRVKQGRYGQALTLVEWARRCATGSHPRPRRSVR